MVRTLCERGGKKSDGRGDIGARGWCGGAILRGAIAPIGRRSVGRVRLSVRHRMKRSKLKSTLRRNGLYIICNPSNTEPSAERSIHNVRMCVSSPPSSSSSCSSSSCSSSSSTTSSSSSSSSTTSCTPRSPRGIRSSRKRTPAIPPLRKPRFILRVLGSI